jgi:hypothetical protein
MGNNKEEALWNEKDVNPSFDNAGSKLKNIKKDMMAMNQLISEFGFTGN